MNEFDIPNISYYSIRNSQDNNIIHTIFSFSLDMCRLGKSWNMNKNIIYEKILDLFKKIKEDPKMKDDIER